MGEPISLPMSPGNVHDSIPYLERLDRQRLRFGFETESVGLDAGYFTAGICKGLNDRDIYGVISYRRPTHRKGYFYKREYQYDPVHDHYTCPHNHNLIYKTTDRNGYRHYKSDASVCIGCPDRERCTSDKKAIKTVTRHVWKDHKETINQHRLTEGGRLIYARRKETVERSFADAKEHHAYRYARFRGLNNGRNQCLMVAAVQNMKKIALMAA